MLSIDIKRKSAFKDAQNAKTQIMLSLHDTFLVLTYSVSGHQRPNSDCANVQGDQGLHCPHMPEDVCSHGAAHLCMQLNILLSAEIVGYSIDPLPNPARPPKLHPPPPHTHTKTYNFNACIDIPKRLNVLVYAQSFCNEYIMFECTYISTFLHYYMYTQRLIICLRCRALLLNIKISKGIYLAFRRACCH